jgi:hypothetical protein
MQPKMRSGFLTSEFWLHAGLNVLVQLPLLLDHMPQTPAVQVVVVVVNAAVAVASALGYNKSRVELKKGK